MFIKQLGNVKNYFLDKFIYNKNPLSALSTATIQELKQKNSRITVSQVALKLIEKISQEKDANIREEAQKFYQQTMLNDDAARLSVQLRGEKFAEAPYAELPNLQLIDSLSEFHETMKKQ